MNPVSLLLGEAFAFDPWIEYVFRGSQRPELIARLFEPMVRAGLGCGGLFVTEPTLVGAAVGLAPGTGDLPDVAVDGDLGADLKAAIGVESFARYVRYDAETRAAHEQAVPGRHWYVVLIGVAIGQRRQGIGTALLAPLLARADADGLPTYLETASKPSVQFYERLGFGVVGHGADPDGTSLYWTMVRPPGR